MEAIDQLKQAMKKNLPPVYLWHGEERYLIQEALRMLKQHYLAQDPSGSSIEILSAKTVEPTVIIEIANTVSFFGAKLVIIEDIPYFQDGQTDELDVFYNYFSNPNPATCCIFIAQSINRGRKFYKKIEQAGQVLEFSVPKRSQDWLVWLEEELKKRRKSMRPDTKMLFLDWAGHHPGILCAELDKLTVYVGEREEIHSTDIKELVAQAAEATVFELTDAVATRSTALALQKLKQVLREEAVLKVLTMLTRQVRLLLGLQAMRRQGKSLEEAPRLLAIKPYEAQKLWQKSGKFGWDQLVGSLQECLQTELAIKTGKGEPEFLLEIMVVKLCTQ